MTNEQLSRILSGAGYPENTGIQTPEIATLILTTNMGIDYHRDRINFDTENGLIEIKQYYYKAICGVISKRFDTDDNISFRNVNCLNHPKFKFRGIQTGDIVFVVNKSTEKIVRNAIVVLGGYSSFKLNKKLDFDPSSEIMYYADPEYFKNSSADTSLNPPVYFTYKPFTENDAEIYLDIGELIGIEFNSDKLGNN